MLPSLQQESSLILFTLLFLISTLQQVSKNDSVKMMPAAWVLIMFWTSLQVNFSTVAPVWQFKNRSHAQSKKSWLVRVIKRTTIFEYKVTDLLKIIWIYLIFLVLSIYSCTGKWENNGYFLYIIKKKKNNNFQCLISISDITKSHSNH